MSPSELRVLVVDDEAPARAALRHRLKELEAVRVVGEAASGSEALEAIGELDPDAVFLDIEMADGDGFDVVGSLPEADAPAVVFVTAYDQYAVDAFEAHALDYVLKPASRERLSEVVARVRRRLDVERDAADHRWLLARMADLREELLEGGRPARRPAPARPGREAAARTGGGPAPRAPRAAKPVTRRGSNGGSW